MPTLAPAKLRPCPTGTAPSPPQLVGDAVAVQQEEIPPKLVNSWTFEDLCAGLVRATSGDGNVKAAEKQREKREIS